MNEGITLIGKKIKMSYCSCGFFTADAEVAHYHSVGADHSVHYWITKAQADADARFRNNYTPSSSYNPCADGCRCD